MSSMPSSSSDTGSVRDIESAHGSVVGTDDTSIDPKDDEGGRVGWLTIIGSALVYFASFGFTNSFGTFQDFYQFKYLTTHSPSTIAFIGTLQLSLSYVTGPVAGALFDMFGLKYMYPCAGVGLTTALLALSFTHAEQIWQQFLTQGLLYGLVLAFGVTPAITVVGHHFKRRRSLAMGIVTGCSSVGGVCFSIMFSRLRPEIGFGWSLRIAALITGLCYSIATLLSRTRLPPKKMKSFSDLVDYRGFKDVRYLILAIGSFIANLGFYIPFYYVQAFAVASKFHSPLAGYFLPLINACSFLGRILGGYIADKVGRLNMLCASTTFSGILVLTMWLTASSINHVIVFSCLFGFCSGATVSTTPGVIGEISPEDKLGARLGAFFSVSVVAILVGPPIGGALIQGETREGYQPLIIFSGITLIVGGVLYLGTRFVCEKKQREEE